jgi:hypothetical protein
MGNIVAGEALRQCAPATVVESYIAAQAAISAHVYDNQTPIMTKPPIVSFPSTPDVYGYYWQPGGSPSPWSWMLENRPPYMAPLTAVTTRFRNHYNSDDYALAWDKWGLNQQLKPDDNYFIAEDGFYYFNLGVLEGMEFAPLHFPEEPQRE